MLLNRIFEGKARKDSQTPPRSDRAAPLPSSCPAALPNPAELRQPEPEEEADQHDNTGVAFGRRLLQFNPALWQGDELPELVPAARAPGQADAFAGGRARRDFFNLFHIADPKFPKDELPDSARQAFLTQTSEAGLTPLPLLTGHNHLGVIRGLSDAQATALAAEIGLPEVQVADPAQARQALLEQYIKFDRGKDALRAGRVPRSRGRVTREADSGKTDTAKVTFNNYSLGDTMGQAYAAGLARMVEQGAVVEELHLANNDLGPTALEPLAQAIAQCSKLKLLDLSGNPALNDSDARMSSHIPKTAHPKQMTLATPKTSMARRQRVQVGVAGVALAEALADNPSIEELRLHKTELGDRTAGKLLSVLRKHPGLVKLDLSANEIGSSRHEQRLGVGGLVALVCESKTLHTLQLGWNSLSGLGGSGSAGGRLAEALSLNQTLRVLDLSWNSLGDAGAMLIGSALRLGGNASLTSLDLSHNDIRERGTMVIGDMCKENTTLKQLWLDSNPIGERGGRAILRAFRAMLEYGIDRDISLSKTNFQTRDETSFHTVNGVPQYNVPLFDPAQPGGTYELHLDDPYDRCDSLSLSILGWSYFPVIIEILNPGIQRVFCILYTAVIYLYIIQL